MVLVGGAFGRWLVHESEVLTNETAFMKEMPQSFLSPPHLWEYKKSVT